MASHQYVYVMSRLSKTWPGGKEVLKNISLSFLPGAKIGVLGLNGAGKSTLLRIMAGIETEFQGEAWAADGIKVGYLPQEPELDPSLDVAGNVLAGMGRAKELVDRFNEVSAKFAEEMTDDEMNAVIAEQAELQEEIDAIDGWDLERKAEIAMDALRVPAGDADVTKLSGGEKAKLALARQLVGLAGVDVIFLDEPTNHLDIQTTEWLEGFLRDFKGAQLIVSHDRYFLDQVCTRIVEIDNLRNWNFKGNYSQYLKQKQNFLAALDDRIKTVEKKISHTQSALRSMKSANKYDKSISAKHKMIERMQQELKALKARKPKQRKGLRFNLEAADKSSNDIIELKDVSKRFDGLQRPILDKQNLEISKGDRIGIVGGNGQGKTTLLKVITGDEQVDSGERDLAPGAIIGYYHQDHRTLDFKLDPVKQVEVLRPDMQYGDIRAALGRFQFSKEQVTTPLGKLSGGERARVALLKLLLEENNLLLLDEPTNHLDMDAKETLEEALVEYDGAIVTVSHDRWFLDQVVNQIWELQDGIVTKYYGNYTDYIRKKKGLPPLVDGEEPVL